MQIMVVFWMYHPAEAQLFLAAFWLDRLVDPCMSLLGDFSSTCWANVELVSHREVLFEVACFLTVLKGGPRGTPLSRPQNRRGTHWNTERASYE